jgi:hypothetical protein
MKKRLREGERWARDVGLDVSAKPDKWEMTVALETSGELPERFHSGRTVRVWVKIYFGGWWMELSQPVGRWEKISSYVSGKPRKDRWHEYFVRGERVPPLPRPTLRKRDRLEPPTRLASVRKWLTRVEEQCGFVFRRDRPLIESNIKGGAKVMAAWINEGG